jgi:4-amino-4-deoxychorismate lyase
MRRAVLEAARTLGIRADECDLALPEVLAADELFMCNSLFGIWPVTNVDGRRFAVGATTTSLMVHLGIGHDP